MNTPQLILSNGQSGDWPKKIVIHTDGASRGNPGLAAIGIYVLNDKGEMLYEEGSILDETTNNVAEYRAVLQALDLAVQNKVSTLTIKTDSQLIVRQIQGLYKIKSKNLKDIHLQCQKQISKIQEFSIYHVYREQNEKADELANQALDL